jgi:hypothetical protein
VLEEMIWFLELRPAKIFWLALFYRVETAVCYCSSISLKSNNDDTGFTYSGNGWVHQANRGLGDSNNNTHATINNGESVSCTFTGTGVDYITETNTDEGNVDVYIDDTYVKSVAAYSSTRHAQVTLFSTTGLANGKHTIKLVKTSGTFMLLDALKIHL